MRFILYPKRGLIKIEGVVLNRGCIYFVLNRVKVSNPQMLTFTQISVGCPAPSWAKDVLQVRGNERTKGVNCGLIWRCTGAL